MLKKIVAICVAITALCLATGCKEHSSETIDRSDSAAIEDYFKFENAPKEIVPFLKGTKKLTAEDVIRISEKGNPTLEDFRDYSCTFSGNKDAYVVEFEFSERLVLQYIYNSNENSISFLIVCADDSTATDIRNGDVQEYINNRKA